MASPMPDIDPDEIRPPLPCSRYPQCRQECTWPTCNEQPPVDQAAAWAAVLDRLERLRRDRRRGGCGRGGGCAATYERSRHDA